MHAWWYVVYSTFIALGLVATGFAWSFYIYFVDRRRARDNAEQILEAAQREAGLIRKKAEVDAVAHGNQVRAAADADFARQRDELIRLTGQMAGREESLDRRGRLLEEREATLNQRLVEQDRLRAEAATAAEQVRCRLAETAGLTPEQAREAVLEQARETARQEAARASLLTLEEARREARQQARRITVLAIEKDAAQIVADATTANIPLPTEDMKGRLIGKDGRNIRSIESELGINLIVDETPGEVTVSCCDPVRREVARQTLVRLIGDGRIHPGRVEEVAGQVRAEVEETIRKAGRDAVEKLSLRPVAPEISELVGRLSFRTSYAQNVLLHSIEMAGLMGTLAAETGLDEQTARRIGLFHDLGKVLPQEEGGSHALAGAQFLRQHGEDAVVVNAVAAHHEEVPAESLYAHLCRAADAITAARPGARQENAAGYIRRIEALEGAAAEFPGVQSSFAVYAGRELRVLVDARQVDDARALELARLIAQRVRDTVPHAGPVRVIVIRETRAVEIVR